MADATSTSSNNPANPPTYGSDTIQKTGKKRRREDQKFEPHDPICVKDATDLQRIRLERLMKNPDKPVFIPGPPKEPKMRQPREFIRNIWGSSAGVGSGDFHIYRGIRRREYERQKFVLEKAENEELEKSFVEHKTKRALEIEDRAERRRAKRQRKKAKAARRKHVEARTRRLREQLAANSASTSSELGPDGAESSTDSDGSSASANSSENEGEGGEPKAKAPLPLGPSASDAPPPAGGNAPSDDSESSRDSFDVPPSAAAGVQPPTEPTTQIISKNSDSCIL